MPVSCSAYGCTNRQMKNSGIRFFKFPFQRKNILKKWIYAVRRKNFKPTMASRVCSVHFEKSDFLQNERWLLDKLKPDAVPSIFPTFPEHLQKKRPKIERKTCHLDVSEVVVPSGLNIHRCKSNLGIGSAEETEVTNNVELHPEDDGKVVHVSTMTEKKEFANASTGSELKEWANRHSDR